MLYKSSALALAMLVSPTFGSECSAHTTCGACTGHNAVSGGTLAMQCYFCPLDPPGEQCHNIGAILTSKCYGIITNKDCMASPTSSSTCPMKSPDFCPESVPQIRVTKGLMSREYNTVRVSLISPVETLSKVTGFDYSKPFQWKWQQLALSSSLLEVPEDKVGSSHEVPFNWMHGESTASVSLPKQGEGTVGLIIADPCVNKGLGEVPGYCSAGERFKTHDRIPEMTNAIMKDGTVKYWATLGDNWYDPTGHISQALYAKYSKKTLQALNVVIPGNHDYWSFGPALWPNLVYGEQCGNGFMQYNGMDTMAAKALPIGSSEAPFDFSIDPNQNVGHGAECAAAPSNMNFYQQIGNTAIIGYTGAQTYGELEPFFAEACAAVRDEPTVDVLLLVSHWDDASGVTGGQESSTTPAAFSKVMRLDGCKQFHEKRMFKWITGHTHCNTIAPWADKYDAEVAQSGFRVSGMGMAASESTCKVATNGTWAPTNEAKPNFGFPVLDTTGGILRILYFDTSDDDKYAAALSCINAKGWKACAHLATIWLHTPIIKRDGQ